jgi:hypothetical protein
MIFFNAYKNIFILFKKTILTILFFKMTFMITFTSSALGSVEPSRSRSGPASLYRCWIQQHLNLTTQ